MLTTAYEHVDLLLRGPPRGQAVGAVGAVVQRRPVPDDIDSEGVVSRRRDKID